MTEDILRLAFVVFIYGKSYKFKYIKVFGF